MTPMPKIITRICFFRSEYITSQRLVSVLESVNFDIDQFAYIKNRSATQALLLLVETIKKSIIQGGNAAVICFDFADTFGSVDRNRLLLKLGILAYQESYFYIFTVFSMTHLLD